MDGYEQLSGKTKPLPETGSKLHKHLVNLTLLYQSVAAVTESGQPLPEHWDSNGAISVPISFY